MDSVLHPAIEPQSFKDVMSHWASGVTVVTTCRAGALSSGTSPLLYYHRKWRRLVEESLLG